MKTEKLLDLLNDEISKGNRQENMKKDIECIKELSKNADYVEKMKKLSLPALYRVFKSIGFTGNERDLAFYLHEVGIRKKKEVAWLKNVDTSAKCECGGNLVSPVISAVNGIGVNALGYERGEYYKKVSEHEKGAYILSVVRKLINNTIQKKFKVCSVCDNVYKKSGNTVGKYVKDNKFNELLVDKMPDILVQIAEILKKYPDLYVKKSGEVNAESQEN